MRRATRIALILGTVAIVMGFVCAGPGMAQESPLRPELRSKFQSAVEKYRQGNFEESAKLFDEVLKLQPTSREALAMREAAGMDLLIRMLRDPKLAPAARDILRKAEKEATAVQRDPATIKALIAQIESSDVVEHWAAIRKLAAVGSFAVPYLLDNAVSGDAIEPTNKKVGAITALKEMGVAATMPMATALYYSDDEQSARIAAFLSSTLDSRAVPALLAVANDPKRAEFARNEAARTLNMMHVDPKRDAAKAFYDLAERYYYEDPSIVEIEPPSDRVIWRWNADKKTYAQKLIPSPVQEGERYIRLMTQGLVLQGLQQPHESLNLIELYASNSYMRLIEAGSAAKARGLADVDKVNEMIGPEVIYRSLGRALNDSNTVLAQKAIDALRDIGDPRVPAQNTLVDALKYNDKTIRVSAAETLMELSPTGSFGGTNDAATIIAAGLGAQLSPRVVVISQDDKFWRRVSEAMEKEAIIPLGYASVADGILRIKTGVPSVSVLLFDARNDNPASIISSISKDSRSANLPVIIAVAPEAVAKTRAELGAAAAAVVAVNDPAQEIAKKAASAAASSNTQASVDIRQNVELMTRALETLAALPPNSGYPVEDMGRKISGLLDLKDNKIRILALAAIKNLPDAGLRSPVFGIYADEKEPADVRIAAGKTFLSILAKAPDLPKEQMLTMLKLSTDKDKEISRIAIVGIGMASQPLSMRESRAIEFGGPAH